MPRISLLVLFLCALSSSALWAEEDCVECHRTRSPSAVAQWEASAHADKVSCGDCHGQDHARIEKGEAQVTAAVCGRCHQQDYAEHRRSKHGLGLHSGWGCTRNLEQRDPDECRFCHEEGSTLPKASVQCARFLKQSSAMGELGCNRCHQVESSCASCHTNHTTDLKAVRDPNVCAKCHMGPDHPQWEMWQTSQHGTLYASLGGEVAPDCQRCHMPAGSHDVSAGITLTPAGDPVADELVATRREQMVQVCVGCHSQGVVERELQRADTVREQSRVLVKEAESIVWDLHDRKLLAPMPDARPEHPLRGPVLVTDAQMLYEDTSHIERLLFKMKKFDFAKTWKGAYHQSPAYTHWYGNAELKMDLVDIRSEALRLSQSGAVGAEEVSTKDSAPEIEEVLEVLQRRFERGALSPEDYQLRKTELLKREFSPAAGISRDDDHGAE